MSAKILLVEDNQDARTSLALILSTRGYAVATAADGQEAVEHVKTDCPDLILSDINMPNLDGLSMVKVIRTLPHCQNVPIVMMSAYGSGPLGEALRAGATAALRKPLNFQALSETLARFLS